MSMGITCISGFRWFQHFEPSKCYKIKLLNNNIHVNLVNLSFALSLREQGRREKTAWEQGWPLVDHKIYRLIFANVIIVYRLTCMYICVITNANWLQTFKQTKIYKLVKRTTWWNFGSLVVIFKEKSLSKTAEFLGGKSSYELIHSL